MDLDDLYLAARSRDAGAWDALGHGLSDELARFFGKCFDRVATEDLVQTTVVVIMHKLEEFEPAGPHAFRNWVYAIAGRQARASTHEPRREQARRSKLSARACPTPMRSPGTELLRREQLDLVARYLPRLPDAHRRALESELAGDDHRSFAMREGISPSGARVRRHRALAKLRQLIESNRATPDPSSQIAKR